MLLRKKLQMHMFGIVISVQANLFFVIYCEIFTCKDFHIFCLSCSLLFVRSISCIYVFLIFVTPLLSKQIMVYHFPHDQYRFNHVCNSSDDTLYIPLSPIVLAVHVKYLMFVVGKEKKCQYH
jgi:hypothetical protein